MEEIDIAIIGAGVIGLAIASEITETKETFLFEKNKKFGEETSSRNSEVIHSGIYYPKNSLKAKLCKKGKEAIYNLKKEEVPYEKIGKLIVATSNKEINELEKILKQAKENEINDLKFIRKQEIKKIEPHINALAAIHSPSTGIINSHKLMEYFLRKAKNKIIYDSEIIKIKQIKKKYKVTIRNSKDKEECFLTKIVINCAGLYSEKIARMVGIKDYKIHLCKGEYFSINRRHNEKITRLIYPIPNKIGLGIHTVKDLQRNLKLGPNTFFVKNSNYAVNPKHQKEFFEATKVFLPFLEYKDLSPDMSGIRPILQTFQDQKFKDFIISEESNKGFSGLINLLGIDSPGLTAAPAIGKYVAEIIKEFHK